MSKGFQSYGGSKAPDRASQIDEVAAVPLAASAAVVSLPGAALAPVIQTPRRGRFPAVVTPILHARNRRLALTQAAEQQARPEGGGVLFAQLQKYARQAHALRVALALMPAEGGIEDQARAVLQEMARDASATVASFKAAFGAQLGSQP